MVLHIDRGEAKIYLATALENKPNDNAIRASQGGGLLGLEVGLVLMAELGIIAHEQKKTEVEVVPGVNVNFGTMIRRVKIRIFLCGSATQVGQH